MWTNVTDADGQKLSHVWKLGDKQVFAAPFDIKSKRWRFNSRRRTPAPGDYTVTTVTEDNTALGEVKFTVE